MVQLLCIPGFMIFNFNQHFMAPDCVFCFVLSEWKWRPTLNRVVAVLSLRRSCHWPWKLDELLRKSHRIKHGRRSAVCFGRAVSPVDICYVERAGALCCSDVVIDLRCYCWLLDLLLKLEHRFWPARACALGLSLNESAFDVIRQNVDRNVTLYLHLIARVCCF